jgi:hypothetical protein
MTQATMKAIKLESYWRGALSDDQQMAAALRGANLVAHAPRQGLLLTPASCSWAGFVAFGVRQYRLIYIHQPASWAIAFAFLWAPPVCLAVAAPGLADGSPLAWAALALILLFAEVRMRLRRGLQRALWPDAGGARDNRRWRVERLLRPVWHLVHAVCAAGAPLSRTIDWAGIRYRVDRPQKVIIEGRVEPH